MYQAKNLLTVKEEVVFDIVGGPTGHDAPWTSLKSLCGPAVGASESAEIRVPLGRLKGNQHT